MVAARDRVRERRGLLELATYAVAADEPRGERHAERQRREGGELTGASGEAEENRHENMLSTHEEGLAHAQLSESSGRRRMRVDTVRETSRSSAWATTAPTAVGGAGCSSLIFSMSSGICVAGRPAFTHGSQM